MLKQTGETCGLNCYSKVINSFMQIKVNL